MPKLTDTQLIVLSSAAGAQDGLARRPANMTSASAAKVAASLAGKGLTREIRAKPDTPVWREDSEGRGLSLKITRAGRDAIGVIEDEDAAEPVEPAAKPVPSGSRAKRASLAAPLPASASPSTTSGRTGSKKAEIIALLMRDEGASLGDLIDATGWLPHTTRAALTGLRKAGHAIERQRDDRSKTSTYRILPAPASVAA